MYPHSLRRHQALGLLMLASLVAALCFPSSLQAAPPGKQAPPEGPDNNKTAQTLAAQQGMEPQVVLQMLEAGIPPEDISPALAGEWPAHLQRLAERNARRQARAESAGAIPPEQENPPTSSAPTDEVQRLWLAIETARSAGQAPSVAALAGKHTR